MTEGTGPVAPGKARILVITRNLPPLRGGMERLNLHLVRELSVSFELAVCCPHESAAYLPEGTLSRGVALQPLSRFIFQSAAQGLLLARRFRPGLVLAGSGLTAPIARIAASMTAAKSAAYLHGLDIVVDHGVYQRLWVPQFRCLDLVLTNSRYTASLAARAGVPGDRSHVLHPGVQLPVPDAHAAQSFKHRFDLGQRRVLLSVGRLTERKGLTEFVEAVMPGLTAAIPDLVLVVIGGEASQSLKAGASGQLARLHGAVERLGLQDHVRAIGEVDDATMTGAFLASCALAFPVLDLPGDAEGFGMVAVEAAAHGVPTVAFAVGGVTDAVSDQISGSLIRPGDYAGMKDALVRYLASGRASDQATVCRLFAARFEWSRFGERLRSLCADAIGL
jgi:phosphatidylinositol alpha-1,6-mannosyltransferase